MNDEFKNTEVIDLSFQRKEKKQSHTQPCFIQYSGRLLGKRYDIVKDQSVVGRDISADITIKEEGTVSRKHAIVEKREDGFYLNDNKSTNGVFINEARIKEAKLTNGDLVQLGPELVLKFFSEGNIEKDVLDELINRGTIDVLTQIYNKRYLLEQFEIEIKNAFLYLRPMSILMFDIDYFKQVNDTHGHLAGDFILFELAKAVKEVLREQDIFARYGGEEFILILPNTLFEDAVQLAERIRSTIETHKFEFDDTVIPTTISIGVSLLGQGMSIEALIESVDKKLYQSKTNGRNCVTSE